MHTIPVFLKSSDPIIPYMEKMMSGSRAVRNTANYLIRNIYTALHKDPCDRTSAENSALIKVGMCLRQANENIRKAFETKMAKALAEGVTDPEKLPKLRLLHALEESKTVLLNYRDLDAVLKLSENDPYRQCVSHVAQHAIKKTTESWKSFWGLQKSWQNGGLSAQPKIPGYIREEMTTAGFTNQVCRITQDGDDLLLSFAKGGTVCIGTLPVQDPIENFVKAEAVQKGSRIALLLTFRGGPEPIPEPENPERICAIDPGVDNLTVCVTNTGAVPLLIDGKKVKSVNQFYNKERARLVSCLPQGSKDDPFPNQKKQSTRRLRAISAHRECILRDYFYKTAHQICSYAKANGVQVIVFGHNKGQKQNVNIGHQNNQTFVQIPYLKLYSALETVAAKYGIALVQQEESYTSKADFFAQDPVPVYGSEKAEPVFSGRRVKRGLYRSASGAVLNADVNGAANILRKRYPEAFKGKETSALCSARRIGYRDLYPLKAT